MRHARRRCPQSVEATRRTVAQHVTAWVGAVVLVGAMSVTGVHW